jgi:hypothetical protein
VRLAIRVDRKLKSTDVIEVLSDLFILRGVRGSIASQTIRLGRRDHSVGKCDLPTLNAESVAVGIAAIFNQAMLR